MFGWRAKIGCIMPSSGTVVDAEWVPHAPKGVSEQQFRGPVDGIEADRPAAGHPGPGGTLPGVESADAETGPETSRRRRGLIAMRFLQKNALLVLIAVLVAGTAAAQSYPTKLVRIIVANPVGGPADVMARIFAQGLSGPLGQPVVVDNRPGADGLIGATAVARAAPDGCTLYYSSGSHTINASLYRNSVPYRTLEDFDPVILIGDQPFLIAVPASLPVKNLREFIALAKSKPGALNYGATASITYLSTELFTSMAGVQITRVPYKGAAPAMTALMAGDVQLVLSGIGPGLPLMKGGRLKALAVTSAARSPLAPDLPAASESGLPGYVATSWYGVLAPAGTPRPIIDRLNKEIRALLNDPVVKEQLAPQAMVLTPSTPEEFASFLRADVAKWARVVQESGVKVE